MSQETSTARPTAPTQNQGTNGLAIAGLVCGLVGLLPGLFNLVLGPLAVIFGVLVAVAATNGGSFYWHVG